MRNIQNWISIQFPEMTTESKKKRGAGRKNDYAKALKARMLPLLREIGGLTATQFGENVNVEHRVNVPLSSNSDMQVAHRVWGNGRFKGEKAEAELWKALQKSLAYEIQNEPQFRSFVKKFVEEHAVLSTEPTKKGWPMFNEIDKGHDYIPIQYVQGKKLSDFTSDSTRGSYDFPSAPITTQEPKKH